MAPHHIDIHARRFHRPAHSQLDRLPAADRHHDARVELDDGCGRQGDLEFGVTAHRHVSVGGRDGHTRERIRVDYLASRKPDNNNERRRSQTETIRQFFTISRALKIFKISPAAPSTVGKNTSYTIYPLDDVTSERIVMTSQANWREMSDVGYHKIV